MADTSPLAEMIARYADQTMLDAIAREYQKGRLLLIGTTRPRRPAAGDLEHRRHRRQRPSRQRWNCSARSCAHRPRSPGLFQPVLFDVEIDGKKYQEMHVDGGAIAQLFLYPPSINLAASGRAPRTARLRHPQCPARSGHAAIERRTISIAGRAINTMLAASGHNDVLRTYFVTQRDGVDYNLAYIGADFSAPKTGEFDQAYMRALYDYGFQEGRGGKAWHKLPPGLQRTATPKQSPHKADAS